MPAKVVLINPPVPSHKVWVREGRCQQWDIWGAPFPPLSLAMIARQLDNAGFETLILDAGPAGMGLGEVVARVRDFAPLLAVVATATPTLNSDLAWFCPELKKARPGISIAAIGIHVSVLPQEVLEAYPHLDFVIRGEPEITALELADSLAQGNNDPGQVPGLALRRDGRVCLTPPRPFIKNLDSLGLPLWQGIDRENYLMPIRRKPFSLISLARGCPYLCSFCTAHVYNGRRTRLRPVSRIIQEIEDNLAHGVSDFLFWTENASGNPGFLRALLDEITARGLHRKISWVCNSRPDLADGDLFEKMKRAGCWQVAFGFEFGDDHSLSLVNKGAGYNVALGLRTARLAAGAGLAVDGHFIMGYPGQKAADLRATIDYALRLPLTFAHFYAATPFPGSELYDQCLAQKLIAPGQWGTVRQDAPAMRLPGLPSPVVASHIRQAYRRFYSSPKVAWRILSLPRNPREYVNLFATSARFLRDLLRG
ncbi:MAG: B12-binding domain-containing radical SAM protein [Desulfarculaceae bacterium]|nr:B12-binding domain-containing radical SAM protein [Desulfarculaceae bacterium]